MHWHALDSHDGRYLRLTFIKLPVHSQRRVLALGEIRVIGDRRGEQGKLAFGKDISIQNFREDEVGNTSLLIDGFTNGRKLVSEKLYVEQLAKRSIVEQAYSNVVEQLAVARASRIQRYWFVGIIAAVLAVFSLLLWLLHLKNHRKRAVFHIQQQIAADLHDDISGNLGTISMITNRLRDMTHDTGMKEKLREVLHLSQESYISVKEIIWHADSETTHLSDLFEQIRRTARSILSDLQVVYEFPDEFEDRVVASKARRDIILLVKESLYNCAKYAKAEHITIKAKTTQSSLLLTTSVQLRASFEAI